jgi:REP-associated tyrosine transposase
MPRQPRFFAPDQPLHVIQRGNNRCAIFGQEEDYRVFHDWFTDACHHHECLVHAYVLMTNHVHLIMTPRSARSVGHIMQYMGRRYVPYFNRKYGRTGTLWEGRYRSTLINSDQYLFTCSRYVELNPVRAGIVDQPSQYRWSSYRANALGQNDPLVVAHERYVALGRSAPERQAAYGALFDRVLDQHTLTMIRLAIHNAWSLGCLPSGESAPGLNRLGV